MTRVQTMVQLTEQLVDDLDREARRTGESRSAVIRTAVSTYLAELDHVTDVRRYVEGYQRQPPAVPDEWGDLDAEATVHGHDLALRLDEEERRNGCEW